MVYTRFDHFWLWISIIYPSLTTSVWLLDNDEGNQMSFLLAICLSPVMLITGALFLLGRWSFAVSSEHN